MEVSTRKKNIPPAVFTTTVEARAATHLLAHKKKERVEVPCRGSLRSKQGPDNRKGLFIAQKNDLIAKWHERMHYRYCFFWQLHGLLRRLEEWAILVPFTQVETHHCLLCA